MTHNHVLHDILMVMSSDSDAIRILTADDHRIIRRGIAGLVPTRSDLRVIAEATNGEDSWV